MTTNKPKIGYLVESTATYGQAIGLLQYIAKNEKANIFLRDSAQKVCEELNEIKPNFWVEASYEN